MRTNNFKLILYILAIAIIQILINNSSKLYLDLTGIIIIILLLSNNYNYNSLIILTIFSDLIGHWYIGTHLLAGLLITFLTGNVTNFFNISNFIHKSVLVAFFYTIFLFIILLIDLCLHNIAVDWIDFIIEIFICTPIILKILNNVLNKHTEDIIF